MAPLFTIPITSTGGSIVCTNPGAEQNIYLLTFSSPPDNRLTPTFIDAFILALDIIEHRYPKGVVVTTSGIAKFYSNGLDLDVVAQTEGYLEKWLWRLFRRFLTYEKPAPIELLNPVPDTNPIPDIPCQQSACSTATHLRVVSCWPCTTTTAFKTQQRGSCASMSLNLVSHCRLP